MAMCTIVKTYWCLNALSESCECGRLMLSKVMSKPAFHSLPFCFMLQFGAWQYGICSTWTATSRSAHLGGWQHQSRAKSWWPSVGGRGDPQRVVANLAHCHHVLLSCHLRATRSSRTYEIAFGGPQVAEYWWSWWSTTSGGKHCPLPPKGHN